MSSMEDIISFAFCSFRADYIDDIYALCDEHTERICISETEAIEMNDKGEKVQE